MDNCGHCDARIPRTFRDHGCYYSECFNPECQEYYRKKSEPYKCSIHGSNGDFKCQECWDNLQRLLSNENTYVAGITK